MLEGYDFNFRYWNYPGEVRLQRKAENLYIEGDLIQPTLYPQQELIAALLACARRVIIFLKQLALRQPGYDASMITYLERLHAEAEAEL